MDRRQFLIRSLSALSVAAVGVLAACSPTRESPVPSATDDPAAAPTTPAQTRRVLVAYFSRPGENYYYGDRVTLETGNTHVVAEMIAAAASVDVYRIEAADPYPEDYEETVARNVREEDSDARPAIAGTLPDVAQYDTILLGSPVWNVQTPIRQRAAAVWWTRVPSGEADRYCCVGCANALPATRHLGHAWTESAFPGMYWVEVE